MPAFNQNVYNRMAKRGVDMNSKRAQRRLGNRSFQANQGTLKKGSWTNKDQMQAQWPQAGGPGGVSPKGTGLGSAGGGQPGGSRGGGGGAGPTLQAAAATMPRWQQQRQNAQMYGQKPLNPVGGKDAAMNQFAGGKAA